jgi:hypothetical protein
MPMINFVLLDVLENNEFNWNFDHESDCREDIRRFIANSPRFMI